MKNGLLREWEEKEVVERGECVACVVGRQKKKEEGSKGCQVGSACK